MYIWTGCKLPTDFESRIRSRCLELNQDIGLGTSGFTLPQHISLKISFDAGDRTEEILNSIEGLLRKESPFYVNPSAIEQAGSILWIAFRENGTLRRLHSRLDKQLREQFGIPQHLFDKAFFFHSTLFFGSEDAICQMHGLLKDFPLPKELPIDTFLLGVSETGKSGTYRVVREIKV